MRQWCWNQRLGGTVLLVCLLLAGAIAWRSMQGRSREMSPAELHRREQLQAQYCGPDASLVWYEEQSGPDGGMRVRCKSHTPAVQQGPAAAD